MHGLTPRQYRTALTATRRWTLVLQLGQRVLHRKVRRAGLLPIGVTRGAGPAGVAGRERAGSCSRLTCPGTRHASYTPGPSWIAAASLPGTRRPSPALPLSFPRSEEHTSELQSRNDISYAVFCLKKKKKKK